MKVRELLLDSSFIVLAALLTGIITGFSYRPRESSYFLLGTIMTLSVTQIDFERMREDGRAGVFPPIALVYVFSPAMTLIPACFLIKDAVFLQGFVVMALVPSAVSLIAFSRILGGNLELALSGTASVYLSSIILMPLAGEAVFGAEIDPLSMVYSLVILVIIPFAISRVLVLAKADERMGEGKKYLINALFFLLIVNIVGANRSAFLIDSYSIILISIICITRTMVAGTILYFFFRKRRMEEEDARTYVLFGTFKNGGLAVALAVSLFSPAAAIPATISIVFDMGSISYYGFLFKRYGKSS